MTRLTLRSINAALAARRIEEKLVRGRGYFYFTDGAVDTWYTSSVLVNTLDALSLDRWLAEHRELATARGNSAPLTKEEYDALHREPRP